MQYNVKRTNKKITTKTSIIIKKFRKEKQNNKMKRKNLKQNTKNRDKFLYNTTLNKS